MKLIKLLAIFLMMALVGFAGFWIFVALWLI